MAHNLVFRAQITMRGEVDYIYIIETLQDSNYKTQGPGSDICVDGCCFTYVSFQSNNLVPKKKKKGNLHNIVREMHQLRADRGTQPDAASRGAQAHRRHPRRRPRRLRAHGVLRRHHHARHQGRRRR
ncbi:hypothetical protein ACJX0J_011563, partial [Zea mays]